MLKEAHRLEGLVVFVDEDDELLILFFESDNAPLLLKSPHLILIYLGNE
jgi:hypothetical protein